MALAVLDVIDAWAQEQRDGGVLKGGFRTLARESFVTVSHAESPGVAVRSLVERATAIGVLDDLQVDPDGRRFTCRVSGWEADSTRGRAALRQADKRNRDTEHPVTTGDDVTSERDVSREVTLGALEVDEKREEKEREGDARELASSPLSEVFDVLRQSDRLHIDRVGVENAVGSWPGQDAVRAARTVITWVTDPAFNGTNAARLLDSALSKQQMAAKREAERPSFPSRRPAQQQASAEDFFKIARGEA